MEKMSETITGDIHTIVYKHKSCSHEYTWKYIYFMGNILEKKLLSMRKLAEYEKPFLDEYEFKL
jgi:hypothetical protein